MVWYSLLPLLSLSCAMLSLFCAVGIFAHLEKKMYVKAIFFSSATLCFVVLGLWSALKSEEISEKNIREEKEKVLAEVQEIVDNHNLEIVDRTNSTLYKMADDEQLYEVKVKNGEIQYITSGDRLVYKAIIDNE